MAIRSIFSIPEYFIPPKQHEWPAERDFRTYNFMSGGILKSMICAGQLKAFEIVVDIGPGKYCTALSELASRVKGIAPFAIAPHIPEVIPTGIIFCAGSLPEGDFSLENVKLITDIFSGVSYASRVDHRGAVTPTGLEVLIRLACWLKPGGVLVACTEVLRLGDKEDWDRITAFFCDHMKLECAFEIYQKFAEGNQVVENQLRITIRNLKSIELKQTYKELVELANMHIGIPICGKVLWESKEKDPEERMRIYETVFVHTILNPSKSCMHDSSSPR